MEPKKSGQWTPLLIVAGVLGGGVVLFILFLVLPAVFWLRAEESERSAPRPLRHHAEVQIPESDGSQAPDFFEDLDSNSEE